MNLVDTSGWLAYLFNTKNAADFAPPIEQTDELLVSVVCLYEVFTKVLQVADESRGLKVIGHMKLGKVIPLTEDLSLHAAQLSLQHKLPMADALIYATALQEEATVWTQDADFEGLPSVRYFRVT